MTPEQLAEAKQYGRYSLACTLADKVLDLLFLTFAAVVLARPLDAWLQGSSLWAVRFAAAGRVLPAVTLLHLGVSLPLSFYPATSWNIASTSARFRWAVGCEGMRSKTCSASFSARC